MTALRKYVLPTDFLMLWLIELEHLCYGPATLKFVRNNTVKRLLQNKTAIQMDNERGVKI